MALILRSITTTFVLAGTLILAGTGGAAEGKHAGMVLIPAGEFTMGREGGPPGEGPTHKLFLPAFFIDRNLVTMMQYSRFIQAKGHIGPKGEQYLDVADEDNRIHRPGDTWQVEPGWEDYPASEMAWHGAVAYCKWLDKQARERGGMGEGRARGRRSAVRRGATARRRRSWPFSAAIGATPCL